MVTLISYDSPAADLILPLEGSFGGNEANLGRKKIRGKKGNIHLINPLVS